MPPRTSSRRRAPAAHAAPSPSHTDAYIKRAVMYHASMITVLWVVGFFFSLGMALTLLVDGLRIDALESAHEQLGSQLMTSNAALAQAQMQLDALKPSVPTAQLPGTPVPPSLAASQYDGLIRGSLSPDGKKYAGYDDVTVGKKGIGVLVLGETKVRHIEIFNTKIESSGTGTADEATMSVRWTDNSTIEYDVLVKKANGTTVKETRSTKIFF